MATAIDPIQQELERLIAQVRLVPGDTELAPGERFQASLIGIPTRLPAPPVALQVSVAWSALSAPDGAPLEPGVAFVAPNGLAGQQVKLVLRPEVIERIAQTIVALRRTVRATVTLTAAGPGLPTPVSVTRELDVGVRVLPLQVPSVLALFRRRGFDFERQEGATLIVVPASSPLASRAAVLAALDTLLASLERLSVFARFSTLASRLRVLTGALADHPADRTQVRRTDAIPNLNQITLVDRAFLANDVEAEDELSSLILLGPTARRVRCFVRRNLDQSAGRLDVTVGDENIVLIGNLHARQPAPVPAGAAVAVVAPPGDRTFGDEISSLELVRPQLLSTLAGRATLEVNTDLTGPDTEPISVILAFSADHRTFVVDSFPPIQGDAATITQEGAATGTFDPGSGTMTLDIVLKLQTLLGTLGLALRLTTGTASEGIYTVTGVPLNLDTGAITLVGAGRLEGSALNPLDDPLSGKEAKVVVEATLDPIP